MQEEKRNTLLEGEGILSITGRIVIVAENLASLCSTVVEKAEIVNDEIGYVAEEISKQSIKEATCFSFLSFFFFLLSKMQEERDKLRKELLSKKEAVLDDLRGYLPIYISKDVNTRRLIREVCSGEKAKGIAG
ncbi:unnamed protein product [Rangifer tarandus platyrhynchus]|uniref:Uncharacterized protein n=2 Tax=Rangifer tarandus platyrhynchus TaxID=3082113 RepID=A0ABN8ZH90_RANTA|nr:unnamed protein product [Rangifer tarandus platyrhynchus]